MSRGGFIRSIENVGERTLPYYMRSHGHKYTQGNYVVMTFDSPSESLLTLKDVLRRDLSIIRPRILRREEELGRPCDNHACAFGEVTDDLIKTLNKWRNTYIKKV